MKDFQTFLLEAKEGMTREEWEAYGIRMGWMRPKKEPLPKREPGELNWEPHNFFDFINGTHHFQFVQANDRYYEITSFRANRGTNKKIVDVNGTPYDGYEISVIGWDGKKPLFKTKKIIAKIEDKENIGVFIPSRMKQLYEKKVVPFIKNHFAETQNGF